MSYCRWSSDAFRSDFYVYESDCGFEVMLAGSRYVSDKPRPPLPSEDTSSPGWAQSYIDHHLAVEEWIKTATLVPIALPEAGKMWTFDDAAAAAAKIKELVAVGYYVPAGVIEALEETAKDPESRRPPQEV